MKRILALLAALLLAAPAYAYNPAQPVVQGGTGAITAPAALTNLGALPAAGGTATGILYGVAPATGDSSTALITSAWIRSQGFVTSSTGSVLRDYIGGLVLSDDASPAAKIDVSPGVATDSTGAVSMVSNSTIVINDAVNGANGLDTGTVAASTWYHDFLISGTSGVAGLMSLSATAPTMPTGYTYFRRIGSTLNGPSSIVTFTQDGQTFWWKTTAITETATALSTTQTCIGLTGVPPGVKERPIFRAQLSGTGAAYILISPDEPNTAPGGTGASSPGYDTAAITSSISPYLYDSGGSPPTVCARSTGTPTLNLYTRGYIDDRGAFN